MRKALFVALSLSALPFLGCQKGTPVAPTGAVLSVTATPTEIPINGQSIITVIATRTNGLPVNPGTEIRLTTTLGIVDAIVETDERGEAEAMLKAGNRSGTAEITATSGGAGAATVSVTVGFRAEGITLTPTPASVVEIGSTVSLLAIVRDDQGEPLGDAAVTFRTELGTLESQGTVVRSNALGEARDTLVFTQDDADLDPLADSFDVSADVGGGGGAATVTVTLPIRRRPRADFTFRTSGLTVEFTDTSTGSPTQWQWTFGIEGDSNSQNPVFTFTPGTHEVTLVASNSVGSDARTKLVTVN